MNWPDPLSDAGPAAIVSDRSAREASAILTSGRAESHGATREASLSQRSRGLLRGFELHRLRYLPMDGASRPSPSGRTRRASTISRKPPRRESGPSWRWSRARRGRSGRGSSTTWRRPSRLSPIAFTTTCSTPAFTASRASERRAISSRGSRGNVLVDSPRFTRPLVRRLEDLGGVALMFLTHRDDVADHQKFREHFGCDRVMHERDLGHGTRGIERPIRGEDPVALDSDLLVIPTPGHTRGSACLLHRSEFLFTGDHLAWSESRGHIYAFRSACWYDWATLVRSSEKLLPYSFEWLLPGHGRRCHFPRERMAKEMDKALHWMREAA